MKYILAGQLLSDDQGPYLIGFGSTLRHYLDPDAHRIVTEIATSGHMPADSDPAVADFVQQLLDVGLLVDVSLPRD